VSAKRAPQCSLRGPFAYAGDIAFHGVLPFTGWCK